MSNISEFTCFTLLPQELQDEIWSHAFWPQLISLHYTKYPYLQYTPPSIGFAASLHTTRFNLSSHVRTIPGDLEPFNTPAPAAFSVCKASRAIVQSKGYKTWRMIRSDGKVRDLLWDPLIDTVLLSGSHDSLLRFFVKQFSSQAREIRSLALPHSWWDASWATKISPHDGKTKSVQWSPELMKLLRSPSTLQELFIMVDENIFDREVKGKAKGQLEFWNASGGFGRGFHTALKCCRKRRGEDSMVTPKVSIASSFDMILYGKDIECPIILDVPAVPEGWTPSRRLDP